MIVHKRLRPVVVEVVNRTAEEYETIARIFRDMGAPITTLENKAEALRCSTTILESIYKPEIIMKKTNREKHEDAMITKEVFKAALVYVGAIFLLLITVSFCTPAGAEEVQVREGYIISSPDKRVRGVVTICAPQERRGEPVGTFPFKCFDISVKTLYALTYSCVGTRVEVANLLCEEGGI